MNKSNTKDFMACLQSDINRQKDDEDTPNKRPKLKLSLQGWDFDGPLPTPETSNTEGTQGSS